jgi:hypothetical protein
MSLLSRFIRHRPTEGSDGKSKSGRTLSPSWLNPLYKGKWQVTTSALVGATVVIVGLSAAWPTGRPVFATPTEFLTFLLGIASILALISSITFGFLLYYFQAVNSEKNLLYGRFKDGVKDLRSFLDELHESGVIDESYDYEFGLVEEVTLKDFPLLSWNERIEGVLNVITDEQREDLEESGDFGRVLRGVAYRVNDIEEAVQALFINWLQQLSVKRMLLPVLKSFGTLVVVILAVLLSVLRYDGAVATILGGFGIGVGTMTLLLIIEVTLIAVRESRELYEFRPEAEEAGEVPDTPSVPDSAADATG